MSGYYTLQTGKISGQIEINKLVGKWSDGPTYKHPTDAGDIVYRMAPDGKFLRWILGLDIMSINFHGSGMLGPRQELRRPCDLSIPGFAALESISKSISIH